MRGSNSFALRAADLHARASGADDEGRLQVRLDDERAAKRLHDDERLDRAAAHAAVRPPAR